VLLVAGSTDKELLAFRLKAQNDSIKIRDLVFTGTNLDSLNNYRIVDSNGTQILGSATTSGTGTVTFENVTPTDQIDQDSTKTYYLIADVNLNTNSTTVTVNLDYTQSNIKGTNGSTIPMS
jgi:hypothetical protein